MKTFLINLLIRYRQNSYKKYIKIDESSVLLPGFRLEVRKPLKDKAYLKIGKDCMIGGTFVFETESGEVIIGNRVYIGGGTFISRSKIEFGNNIFVAWGGTMYDHDSHSLDYKERRNDISRQLEDYRKGVNFIENKNWSVVKSKPINIKDDSWIGLNSIILKGVTIGKGAIVGAGSVVFKDVEDWTVVRGNPAENVKRLA